MGSLPGNALQEKRDVRVPKEFPVSLSKPRQLWQNPLHPSADLRVRIGSRS
jgi:hypothetical protein